jgi:branched-chain amino acid transport system substrate-binding protein
MEMAMKTSAGDPDRRNRRWRPWLAVLAATMLVSAGCGNRESKDEASASRAADSTAAAPEGASPGSGSDAPVDGAAPAADAVTPDAPTGGASAAPAASPAPGSPAAAAPRPGKSANSGASAPAAGGGSGNASQPASSSAASPAPQRNDPAGGTAPAPTPGTPGAPEPGAPAPGSGTAPIVIGNIGTYTGPAGGSLKRFPEGVQVWVKWINDRGGLNGHPVKLIVVDDGGDPARHKAAKQDLIERKGVQAFVGDGEPLAGESSVDYITSKGIPMVGNEGGSDWYYKSPMYFPQAPNGDTYWHSMMPGLAEVTKGKKKFASAACVEAETACGGADRVWHDEGIAKKNGFDPVYRARVSLAQPDYTAECLAAQKAGAEIVVLVLDDTSIGRFANSCGRQRYNPIFAWPLAPAATRHKDDPNLNGGVVLLNFFPWTKGDTPATAEFQAAMKKYFSGTVEPGHAGGWASGKMFEKAALATATPTLAAGILDGLYSFKGETLGGLTMPLSFNRGQPAKRVECWGQLIINSGKYVPVNNGEVRCR